MLVQWLGNGWTGQLLDDASAKCGQRWCEGWATVVQWLDDIGVMVGRCCNYCTTLDDLLTKNSKQRQSDFSAAVSLNSSV